MGKLKILMLEDNKLDSELIKEELIVHKFDFTSILVETKKDFINAVHDFKPDIILSDYNLPQFTGFEALEIAKKLVPDVPFIIVTGSLSEETAADSIKRGAWDYVLKENLLRLTPAIENALKLKVEKEKNKQAEEEIRKLSNVVETTPEAVVITDMQGNIDYVNQSLLGLGGFEDDSLIIGKSVFLFSNEEGVKQLQEEIIPTILSDGKWRGEVPVKRKDGSIFPAEMICSLILDDEGKPKYLLSQYHDITKRKKAERALEGSEKQLQTLIDAMPDFVCFKDGDGRWLKANDAGIRIFQLEGLDYRGKKDSELSELNSHLQGAFLTCKESDARAWKESSLICGEETVTDSDGSVCVYDVTKVPIFYPSGERKGLVILGHDITERKRAEEALRESEEKYRLLADNSIDAIWQTDLKLVFTYISPSVKNIMGYTVEEWVGTRLSQHTSKKEFLKMSKNALYAIKHYKEFKHLTFDAVMLRKDGTEISVEITGKLLLNKKGLPIGLQGTTRDITERKKAEDQIKASLKEKEILLQEIHHRVKNNMQVVSSLLALQSEKISDKQFKELFNESRNRIHIMALAHEKLYQSDDMASIDFSDYTLDLIQYLFESYGVDPSLIKYSIDIQDIFLGIDNAIPCAQIISEFISNSLKHAFPDGRQGEINIDFKKDKAGKHKMIVSDNGIGLPEDLDHRKTKSLGLQLVNALTRQIEGEIELDRSGGTKFIIRF